MKPRECGRFRTLLSQLWTHCNECVLGIRTEPQIPAGYVPDPVERWKGEFSPHAKNGDNFRYETIGYWHVRKLFRVVKLGPEDVVYDIGCGMGRILCLAAQEAVRKCVGIELQEPLCEIARRNAASLRNRKAPVEIVWGDAARADLSEGTIYLFFNPFGPETLRDAFENIRASLAQKPRAVKVVYYHAKYRSAVEPLDWLVKVREFERFGGQHPVIIWESRSSEHDDEARVKCA
jgi:SAM-dependent methyltransferase